MGAQHLLVFLANIYGAADLKPDPVLWHSMAALIKSGAYVIAVETKPPNSVFRKLALEGPRFVSGRVDETGLLIGDWLVGWLKEDDQRNCILWIGPDDSWPGNERSRNVLYQLTAAGLGHRATLMPIPDWEQSRGRCMHTHRMIYEILGEVAICCADDENAIALHVLTLKEFIHVRSRMKIIGCNAPRGRLGKRAGLCHEGRGRHRGRPGQGTGQGSATLLIKQRSGGLYSDERSACISPVLRILDYAKTLVGVQPGLQDGLTESTVDPLPEIEGEALEMVEDNPTAVSAVRARIDVQ